MKQEIESDLETLQKGKPYLRSIVALVLHLRFGSMLTVQDAYVKADMFLKQLERDVKENG